MQTQVMSQHQYSQQRGTTSGQFGTTPAHYHQHQQQAPQPQAPYGGTDQQHQRGGYGGDNRSHRSGRDDDGGGENRRRRSRSNHRSSNTRRGGGSNNNNNDQYPDQSNQFHYPGGAVANNVTPPSQDAASSSNLGQQSSTLDATQRRPAYLLHRDLVIGKGSYGQVCIASRGEAEGHHSNKSGKRKKFACKCVMLRNDPKYIAKLQEEVNVLRELRGHDNVIRLFDVFCVDNELFIITELGRGGDLFHLLTTHPKHGVTEAYAGEFLFHIMYTICCISSNGFTLTLYILTSPPV